MPLPKAIPHRPSIAIAAPAGLVNVPRDAPVTGSNALILPSPKLPTSSALLNVPKSAGAIAIPQGALSLPPGGISRFTRLPAVSKTSTAPTPAPATSSSALASCIA